MRKNTLFLILALGFMVIAYSQPVLTQPLHQPQIGDLFIRDIADTTGITPGAVGAGAVWNFSSISYTGEIDTLFFETVEVDWASNFPTATMEARFVYEDFSFPRDIHSFYQPFPDSLLNHGWAIDLIADGGPWFYLNPRKDMEYPFTYLDSYTDSVSGEFWGFAVSTFTGTVTVTADAYGQIILPYGTFNDVLRVHTLEVTDGPLMPEMEIHKYEYYDYQTRFPLLTIAWDGAGTKNVYSRTAPPATGIAENSVNKPSIYFDPSSRSLFIRSNTSQPIQSIRMMDIQGKALVQKTMAGSATEARVAVSHLSDGIYLLETSTGGKRSMSRVFIGGK